MENSTVWAFFDIYNFGFTTCKQNTAGFGWFNLPPPQHQLIFPRHRPLPTTQVTGDTKKSKSCKLHAHFVERLHNSLRRAISSTMIVESE